MVIVGSARALTTRVQMLRHFRVYRVHFDAWHVTRSKEPVWVAVRIDVDFSNDDVTVACSSNASIALNLKIMFSVFMSRISLVLIKVAVLPEIGTRVQSSPHLVHKENSLLVSTCPLVGLLSCCCCYYCCYRVHRECKMTSCFELVVEFVGLSCFRRTTVCKRILALLFVLLCVIKLIEGYRE